jgi:pimeloyl-ACP methyl ester carboxylesterase
VARYDPRKVPGDYRPGLSLFLRQDMEGGNLLPQVRQDPTLDPRRELLVLVHGFNNHYGEAAIAYFGFRNRQYGNDRGLTPGSLEGLLGDCFWPGDAAWGVFDLVDFMVYPSAVGTARRAGPLLAEHLQAKPNLLKVDFIGHSMGCRVILETIRALGTTGPLIGKVCLMAAAVPVFKVETGEELAGAMERPTSVLVLWSESDLVLKVPFRIGQMEASALYGNEGWFFPTALGGDMPPPTVAGYLNCIEIKGAGHSDYWGHEKNAVSGVACGHAAEYFHFGRWTRDIAGRSVVAAPPIAARATGGPPRTIG